MYRPTLLFVEEIENSLSRKVVSTEYIQVVLLRFKQNMSFRTDYLNYTEHIPSFVFDKEKTIEAEVKRFKEFCFNRGLNIDYFYNDSEYNQEIVQRFASILGLRNSLTEYQSLCVRDKIVMKDMLKEIGLKTVSYKELSSLNDAVDFAKKHDFPVIIKWRKGLSSKEVYKINSVEELESLNIDYSRRRFMAEAFCHDLIWCLDALIQDGKVLNIFFAWLPYTNLSFAEYKDRFAQITVSDKPAEIRFDSDELVQRIADKVGLKNGYMHLEAFVDSFGQPTICEFAWRTPGEHMLLNHSIAFGVDVYNLLISIMIGRKIEKFSFEGKKCVGDMFLPLKQGIIKKISKYDEIKSLEGVIAGEVQYSVGDVVELKRQYTDCAGWVQVEGDTKDTVVRRMLKVYDAFEIIVE